MKLVFVHGWGFDARVWDAILSLLPDRECLVLDLGFGNRVADAADCLPESDYIAIGHSIGSLWLLRHGTAPMKGFVSICGFDNFAKYVPAGVLQAMKERLDTAPYPMMCEFWGTPYFSEDEMNIDRLKTGLDWLAEWNEEKAHGALNCPILALAATKDPIVPRKMTEAIWHDATLKWLDGEDHFLPITHPDWCARQIKAFLDEYGF